MPQCVYVYEDIGDVDDSVDSCGDYMTNNCKCPHTGCYFGTIGIINVHDRGFIVCAGSIDLYEEAGVPLNVTRSDFKR